MNRFVLAVLTVGMLGVFAAGCNVFEGLYEEGSSDDPAVLQEDAQLALQRGEADKAVKYLEKAHEKLPADPGIRTALSTALLQANDINIIKMISVLEEISGEGFGDESSISTMAASKSNAASCNFDESEKVEEIILSENRTYQSIKERLAVLVRVQELLEPVVSDPDSEAGSGAALLNSAISEVLLVLIDVENKKIELGAALWRLENGDVGLCARDGVSLVEFQSFVKCAQIPRMQNALSLLRKRQNGASDDSGASDAIGTLQDNIDRLASHIAVTCS